MKRRLWFHTCCVAAAIGALTISRAQNLQRQWLAGDSHIHSQWSPAYDRAVNPPRPIRAGDAIYPTPLNAQKAREYGLDWMVTTDHGGPNHSKLNIEQAYAELNDSRVRVPEVLQFYGMELNMPAMDHHTLIIPRSADEANQLFSIERQFDANEAWPADAGRNTEAAALRALSFMNGLDRLPLMFANHPSRSAVGIGKYILTSPHELRANNDLAPRIYRGMEGAPGHQANTLSRDGSLKHDDRGLPAGYRGSYDNAGAGTFGGYDQMTAIVGGLWDAMLGEGRRFWIVATSDSHVNFADTTKAGGDFWPGQYHKTYVQARHSYDDVLDGLRNGRIFAVAGDLISELDLEAAQDDRIAGAGATLTVPKGSDVRITIRLKDPDKANANGDNPTVKRVDLIAGDITGPTTAQDDDRNPTTRVRQRFARGELRHDGDVLTVTTTIPAVNRSLYVRVRGTSTGEMEPSMDPIGESPWNDLWFYSNPVFIEVQ